MGGAFWSGMLGILDGQLTVYTDGSAAAGTKDGGAAVIVTRSDTPDPTILHKSLLRGASFTSSFAEEAAAMQLTLEWATANYPEYSLTICTDNANFPHDMWYVYSRQLWKLIQGWQRLPFGKKGLDW